MMIYNNVKYNFSPKKHDENISHTKQQEITRICAKTALLLLSYGAESAIVVSLTHRLGYALGMDSMQCALIPNAIVLTTISDKHCLTTVRKVTSSHIDMNIISQVQHIVISLEKNLIDLHQVRHELENIQVFHYKPSVLSLAVGLSCASFAHLAGGTWLICLLVFVSSSLAMLVRIWLVNMHFNPQIVFSLTAFVASFIAGLGVKFNLPGDTQIALASSVLLLFPGFPLINALADMLKGHAGMGLSRWINGTLLAFGTSIGIVFALSLLDIAYWG